MRRALFLLFWPILFAAAAQEMPRILHFEKNAFGGQNQTWAIAESPPDDLASTLFFANNAGLLAFDGSRWQTFSLPDGQIVRSVACRDGRVFVGGFAEFGYFERDENLRFAYRSLSKNLGDASNIRQEEFWHILAPAGEKDVFFQSFGIIYRFDGQKTAPLEPPAALMFLQKIGPRTVFQGIGRGLFDLLPGGGGFRFVPGSEPLANTIVAFMLPEKNGGGGILLGTKSDGLFLFKNGKCAPWQNPLAPVLRGLQPNKALRLPDGSLAIGTILGGVFVFDTLENLRFRLDRTTGLQNNTVLSMHAGPDGNLWLGLDKGIDFVEIASPVRWHSDLSGQLGSVYSAALFEKNLYIGTNQGVFVRPFLNLSAHREEKNAPDFNLVPGTQGQVWQLRKFAGQLLCGHNDGTFLIKNKTAARISAITGGWATVEIPGSPDKLLQGTYGGLVVFEKKPGGTWAFGHRVEGFEKPVKELAFDNLGNLWICHPNAGIWAVNLGADLKKITEIRPIRGLPTDFKVSLSRRGDQLLARAGGRFFLLKNPATTPAPTENLPNGCRRVFSFFGKNESRFDVFDGEVRFFSGNDAPVMLPISLIPESENIIPLDNDGLFLFCQESGYAIWDSRAGGHFSKNGGQISVAAVEFLSGKTGFFYPKISSAGFERTLSANQNALRIHLAKPFDGQPLRFDGFLLRENLIGFDTIFLKTRPGDFLELANLAPGQYFLKNRAGAVLFSFKIARPWWQSGWAMLGWAGLMMAVFYFTEKTTRHRMTRNLEKLAAENARDLADQRAQSEREFLKNEVENRSRELSNATLSQIRKNEALLELKNELARLELPVRDADRLDRLIENHLSSDADWSVFEKAFNEVHDAFFHKMKHDWPDLTPGDLRLAALLRLNLSSKEIAALLGMSIRGIENKRYRLRKKLGLGETVNLADFIIHF